MNPDDHHELFEKIRFGLWLVSFELNPFAANSYKQF